MEDPEISVNKKPRLRVPSLQATSFWLGLFPTHFDAHQLEALLLGRFLVYCVLFLREVNQLGIIIRYPCDAFFFQDLDVSCFYLGGNMVWNTNLKSYKPSQHCNSCIVIV